MWMGILSPHYPSSSSLDEWWWSSWYHRLRMSILWFWKRKNYGRETISQSDLYDIDFLTPLSLLFPVIHNGEKLCWWWRWRWSYDGDALKIESEEEETKRSIFQNKLNQTARRRGTNTMNSREGGWMIRMDDPFFTIPAASSAICDRPLFPPEHPSHFLSSWTQ